MNFNNANAINFSYLLIEFYKKIGLSEEELAVVLIVDHLISQGNKVFNSSSLALSMNYDEKKIDDILAKLYERKLLEVILDGNSLSISIEPLKKILYRKFQESIFTDIELKENDEAEELREETYERLEKLFNRSLTPVEINRISDWLADSSNFPFIKESLKEAESKRYTSINQIDRAIIKRIRQDVMNDHE